MNHTKKHQQMALLVVAASLLAGPMVRADVVTDWNAKASALLVDAKLGAPPACRVLAIVHTAVYEAANAITRRYPASGLQLEAAPGASVEAAVAAANHATLAQLVPSQQAAIDTAYQAALATIAEARRRPRALRWEKRLRRRSERGAPMTAPPRGRRTGLTLLRVSTCRRSSRRSRSGRSASRG